MDTYRDLALNYVNGNLNEEEKNQAHQLILTCPEFTILVKEELALKKQIQALLVSPSKECQLRIYKKILSEPDANLFHTLVDFFSNFLPPLSARILKLTKGVC